MGRTVVIAEKPSVGRDIARVLGCQSSGRGCLTVGDWVVTWAVGHLVTLVEPDELDEKYKRWSFDTLPILPAEIPLKVIASSRDQFAVVRNLINAPETDRLICATDAGREGELIFRYIYEKAGCKKPFDRLWISSMTDEAIQEGFRAIRSGSDYDGLYRSAQCRSQADWLVGMNASRAFTLRYDALLSVGRVQTPTLAILVKRRKEIEDFKPEEYATVTADFGDYRGMYFREGLEPDTHIPKIDDAKALAAQIKNQSATVISAETTRRRDLPPQLYDLTSLQRDANRLLGFTADKTLKLAQSLYETRKALTYPRTDSRYLTQDMQEKLPELAARVCRALPFASALELHPHPERVVDDSKVSDHPAIIPTAAMPAQAQRINALTTGERDLLHLVCTRLLCALEEPFAYEETTVTLVCGAHEFGAKGKRITQMGWKRIWYTFRGSLGGRVNEEEKMQENVISADLAEGKKLPILRASIEEGKTTPPPHHTEGTLLHAMETAGAADMPEAAERKGIGTPATRAAILEKLIETKLIERVGEKRKKVLVPTTKGKALAAVLPESLRSSLLTSAWEQRLQQIEQGVEKPEDFMRDIQGFVKELTVNPQRVEHAETLFPPLREKIGSCPKCGAAVTEHPQGYLCENRICGFALWKKGGILAHAETPLTAAEAKTLLTKGAVRKTGLHSTRTNARYDAVLHLDFGKDGRAILRPRFD